MTWEFDIYPTALTKWKLQWISQLHIFVTSIFSSSKSQSCRVTIRDNEWPRFSIELHNERRIAMKAMFFVTSLFLSSTKRNFLPFADNEPHLRNCPHSILSGTSQSNLTLIVTYVMQHIILLPQKIETFTSALYVREMAQLNTSPMLFHVTLKLTLLCCWFLLSGYVWWR